MKLKQSNKQKKNMKSIESSQRKLTDILLEI